MGSLGLIARILRFFVLPTVLLGLVALVLPLTPGTALAESSRSANVAQSACTSVGGTLTQAPDGEISTCFEVPAVGAGPLALALQFFRFNNSAAKPGVNEPTVVLSSSVRTVHPGEVVTITGHYRGAVPSGKLPRNANLCWDGCQQGLVEGLNTVRQLGAGRFSVQLEVPDAPWLEGGVAAPLVSGTYRVGINCLAADDGGCDSWPSQGTTTVHLVVAHPITCERSCFRLRTIPSAATPGEVVRVVGFAPIQSLIGPQPFGPGLVDFPDKSADQVDSSRVGKLGVQEMVRGATTLSVLAARTWSALPAVRPVVATSVVNGGVIAVDPDDQRRLAYCDDNSGRIRTSSNGGATWSTLPMGNVAVIVRGEHLKFPNSNTRTSCSTVTFAHTSTPTIFASFLAIPPSQDGIPPEYAAALYTSNGGATWRGVPTPRTMSPAGFVGFAQHGDTLEASFLSSLGDPNQQPELEVTTDGGATWSTTPLQCPTSGPCVQVEPSFLTNCMSEAKDQLVYSPNHGVTWVTPDTEPQISPCAFSEVVTMTPSTALLLNPASGYQLQLVGDGGRSLTYYGLPALPKDDLNNYQGGMEMLPNGSLLDYGPTWELLKAGASAWCPTIEHGETNSESGYRNGPPVVVGNRLLWLRVGQKTAFLSVELSKIACA